MSNSKIHSANLHHSYEASIGYAAAIHCLSSQIRSGLDGIDVFEKADFQTIGTIHALRMLCDGKPNHFSLYTKEILEWKALVMAWFERIKNKIPVQIRDEYLKNLVDDFDVLLLNSEDEPEWIWRKDSLKRQITLGVKDKSSLKLYEITAEQTHPQLGNALHNYLNECLENLIKNNRGS